MSDLSWSFDLAARDRALRCTACNGTTFRLRRPDVALPAEGVDVICAGCGTPAGDAVTVTANA